MKTPLLTICALVAFAANSVLCRAALGGRTIDAASFTTIRLLSGACVLLLITASFNGSLSSVWRRRRSFKFIPALLLFLYAAAFSFAYTELTTGTGALVLFGSVQATMLAAALRSGERPHLFEWAGLLLALAGLVYLVSPGLSAPPLAGSALMCVAGISWGFYSLAGRGARDPLADTTDNFVLALPLAFVVNFIAHSNASGAHVSTKGVALATLSGAVASGVGYVVWYAALKDLTATRAATVQLPVPLLAAFGGVVLMSESLSLRLIVAAALILGGVALALLGRTQQAAQAKAA
ncbi:MAG TPA: DMT family transporter [Pyrinomonadaceae bacterium]|jgi:drug/metabolite transporter (DMT)-like permease